MDITSVSLEWLLLITFILNFVGILILSGNDRFWLPSVIIWLLLLFIFFIGNAFNSNDVSYEEAKMKVEELQTGKVQETEPLTLKEAKNKKRSFNNTMLHLLGFQSFLSLVWTALGYKTTGQHYYRSALITFSVLCTIYLLIVFVPT